MKKKNNRSDLTLRNLSAAKKREATLKERVKELEADSRVYQHDFEDVFTRLTALEYTWLNKLEKRSKKK